MTLQQTTDTIIKWLKSCTTREQVGLTIEAFDKFVRYKPWINHDKWMDDILELEFETARFEDALFHQKISVTAIESQTGAFVD